MSTRAQNRPAVVYKLTNLINGKGYVGVSIRHTQRFLDHSFAKTMVGDAIRKYGPENFLLTVLIVGLEDYCYAMEPGCIKIHDSYGPNGYNLTSGGDRPPDRSGPRSKPPHRRPHSEETKQKLRLKAIGRPSKKKLPPGEALRRKRERAERNKAIAALTRQPKKPRQWSEEEKQAFSLKLKGKKFSEEHKAKISAGRLRFEAMKKAMRDGVMPFLSN